MYYDLNWVHYGIRQRNLKMRQVEFRWSIKKSYNSEKTKKLQIQNSDALVSVQLSESSTYRVFKLDLLQNKCIKNALLSHKNKICTFMRCVNLTYDPWIWLKITSLCSTASVLNDGLISLEIPSFCSDFFF